MMLDVNKIHFILEKEKNKKKILKEIDKFLVRTGFKSLSKYNFSKINLKSRYDDKETILIKRLLQFYFPENLRTKICDFCL